MNKYERRFTKAVNVAYFYRGFLYLILSIYSFVILPIDGTTPIFPNPKWFLIHLTFITLLAILSQANYPNHFTRRELSLRILLIPLAPVLFVVALKERWYDLKILNKREQYGASLIFMGLILMILASIAYVLAVSDLLLSQGLYPVFYIIIHTYLVMLPTIILDIRIYQLNRTDKVSKVDLEDRWEQSTVDGEPTNAYRPVFLNLLATKRARFWILLLASITYSWMISGDSTYPPILA